MPLKPSKSTVHRVRPDAKGGATVQHTYRGTRDEWESYVDLHDSWKRIGTWDGISAFVSAADEQLEDVGGRMRWIRTKDSAKQLRKYLPKIQDVYREKRKKRDGVHVHVFLSNTRTTILVESGRGHEHCWWGWFDKLDNERLYELKQTFNL